MQEPDIRVAEFWQVKGDPLARALRKRGTMAHITAIFGFTLAGLVLQDATK